jgi:ABC-2 type transport system permease protein
MSLIKQIAAREWRSLLFSPTGFVVAGLYLAVGGYLFSLNLSLTHEATLRYTFSSLGMLIVFTVPLVTMRLVAEELRTGTFEVLIAHPVTDWQIVLGKYVAGWMVLLVMTLPTFSYLLILRSVGSPDWGTALSGYLGLQLLSGLMLAIGLMISATTQSQVLAAMGTMIGGILLWLAGTASYSLRGWLGDGLAYLAVFEHLSPFRRGIVDSRSVIYFVGTTVMFLYLAVRAVESRRWKFGAAPERDRVSWRRPKASSVAGVVSLLALSEAILSQVTGGVWGIYQTLLVVFGLAVVGVPAWWNRRRLRYELAQRQAGVAMTVALNSLMVIGIWALIMFLTSRHYVRLDLTRTQRYALSEQTLGVLKNLARPVDIHVVMSQPADLKQELTDLLDEYRARSTRISVQHINPVQASGEVEQLRQRYQLTSVPANELVIASGDQVRRVPIQSLINQSAVARGGQLMMSAPRFMGEAEVSGALLQLTRPSPGRAVFLGGHGERSLEATGEPGLTRAADELRRLGWQIETRVVTPDTNLHFDPETTVVVLAGPQLELADPTVRALEGFLDRGGGVLVLVDPGVEAGLAPLLDRWNVSLGNNIVVDLQEHVASTDPSTLYVTRFSPDHNIGKAMGSLAVVLPSARRIAVSALSARNPYVFTSNFMHTSGNGWAVEYETGRQVQVNTQRDRRGPISLGIACERYLDSATPGRAPLRGRLVVVGDSEFASDRYIDAAGNLTLLVNCMEWLAGRPELLAIQPKSADVQAVTMTARKAKGVFWVATLAVPAVTLAFIGAAAIRRRRSQ